MSADERVGDVCDGRGQAGSQIEAAVHVGMGQLLDLHAIANDGTEHDAATADESGDSAKLRTAFSRMTSRQIMLQNLNFNCSERLSETVEPKLGPAAWLMLLRLA